MLTWWPARKGWRSEMDIVIGVGLAALLLLVAAVVVVRNYRAVGHREPLPPITVARACASDVSDAGLLSYTSIAEALKIRGENPDGYSENPEAHEFGLAAPPVTWGAYKPNLMVGERHGRQVYIRLGHDEAIDAGVSGRHLRQIVVVRASFPSFQVHADRGQLTLSREAPVEAHEVVDCMTVAPDVWTELRVVAGGDGIVSNRPQWKSVYKVQEYANGWAYDLWLLERLADRFAADPLPPVADLTRLHIPYGMGKKTT
jgi:hypothetical protein